MVLAVVLVVGLAVTGLTAARAVLFPQVDSPERVDAIVVVAGSNDDRYVYALSLIHI